ncbi:MAG: 2-thiouracil desulfurase family protein [Myxococcaceae bacterium]
MSEALRRARTVLVSACLLGEPCRYDGQSCQSPAVLRALEGKEVVPICPEAGAGLGTPRPAVELCGGDGAAVLEGLARARVKESGEDRTAQFFQGATLATEAAAQHGATAALLKERSPSCGAHRVWVDGELIEGTGVTAAALRRAGVAVLSDEEL